MTSKEEPRSKWYMMIGNFQAGNQEPKITTIANYRSVCSNFLYGTIFLKQAFVVLKSCSKWTTFWSWEAWAELFVYWKIIGALTIRRLNILGCECFLIVGHWNTRIRFKNYWHFSKTFPGHLHMLRSSTLIFFSSVHVQHDQRNESIERLWLPDDSNEVLIPIQPLTSAVINYQQLYKQLHWTGRVFWILTSPRGQK